MLPLLVAALLGQADPGAAGAARGTDWAGFPGEAAAPAPAPAPPAGSEAAAPSPPPAPPPAVNLPIPPTIEEPLGPSPLPLTVRPEPPNRVSLLGAEALGPGRRAAALSLGFPTLAGRALIGVTPALDLGVSYETLYGAMHDFRAVARWALWSAGGASVGLVGDAGGALFARSVAGDFHGARYLTGRRDLNASGGLVLALQGASPRASRFFLSARAQLAAELVPGQPSPLGGIPPLVQLWPNLATEAGLEAPVSEWVSLAFRLGLDLHGSPDDAVVMVTGAAGVVTALP